MPTISADHFRLSLAIAGLVGCGLACSPFAGSDPTEIAKVYDAGATAEAATLLTQEAEAEASSLALTEAAPQPTTDNTVTEGGGDGGSGQPTGGQAVNLDFAVDQATFSNGGLPGYLSAFCWPPHHRDAGEGYLTVDALSALDGRCAFSEPEAEYRATLAGFLDQANGIVTFHLDTTIGRVAPEGYEGSATITVAYDAEGPVVDGVGTGTAVFTYVCVAEGDVFCADGSDAYTTSGTVPFTISFGP